MFVAIRLGLSALASAFLFTVPLFAQLPPPPPTPTSSCFGCSSGSGGNGGSRSNTSSGPSRAEIAARQAYELNEQGIEAFNKGDWTTAAVFFKKSLEKAPNNSVTLRNLEITQEKIADAQREQEQRLQDKTAASKMRQSIQDFVQSLTVPPSSGGLDFKDTKPGSNSDKSGGLTFMDPGAPLKDPGPQIGAVAECRGAVFMITPGGRQFPLQNGTPIPLNAHVTTGPDGRFQVLLLDETTFTLGPNSDMVLDEFVYDPKTNAGKISANLLRGTFRWVTGKMAHQDPAGMQIKLAVGTIGIRGTDVESEVSPDGSGYVKLFTGHVGITENKSGTLLSLNPGEMVTFTADGTFGAPAPIPPGSRQ